MSNISTILPHLDFIKATPDHMNFLLVHWLKSNASGISKIERLSGYYTGHKLVIINTIANSTTLLAVSKTDHNHALGFITYENDTEVPIVHYVYVKPEYREAGVCTELLNQALGIYDNLVFTHLPEKWQRKYSISKGHNYYPLVPIYACLQGIADPRAEKVDPTEGLHRAFPKVSYKR